MKYLKLSLILLMILFFMEPLSAKTIYDIGFKGIGGKIGLVIPKAYLDNTVGLGMQIDLGSIKKDLDLIRDNVQFDAIVDFWSAGREEGDWRLQWRALTGGILIKYYTREVQNLYAYIGGGLVFTYSWWESQNNPPASLYPELYNSSNSELAQGFHFVGGGEWEFSPRVDGLIEFKWAIDYIGFFIGAVYKFRN